MSNWARSALAQLALGETVALVTILATEGSAPREAGTKMVVWAGGQAGTIGGGNLEHQAAEQARKMLLTSVHFALQDYPLGPLLAQCCGGRVRLLIERL
ncbi:MAG TPA: XdhC family protein, partial [Caulobacter sp.]|nr:XdhC family protein [Caulobacter sp.]